MTGLDGTPEVLHIVETDKEGRNSVVRYYREDTINTFVMKVQMLLHDIQREADKKGEGRQ